MAMRTGLCHKIVISTGYFYSVARLYLTLGFTIFKCSVDWGEELDKFIYLLGVLRRFQHCTGHITMGSWKGRGNQYIQFIRILYCKLLTNGKQLPAFPLEAMPGIESRPQRWEARVLPLCHHGPQDLDKVRTCRLIGA